MAKEVFNRVEKKYLLTGEIFEEVVKRIKDYTYMDKYNIGGEYYTLCSLYFDTDDKRFIRHSLSSPVYKEKLRLRSYGVPKEDSKVYLEMKKKFKGTVNKRRTAFYYTEAMEFLEKREMQTLLPHMNGQVIKELSEFLKMNPGIKPSCIVAYDRLAFFANDNKDLRISFDKDIRTRMHELDLLKGDYGEALIKPDMRLMEIKAVGGYPLWLVDILSELEIRKSRFSKYGKAYMREKEALLNIETEAFV
ncbi:MAG: polyphosphate polymerase domain-containing protein [Clostridia bacterium]|nr:polyphosphate polymerase domain-containing protein [Clostridia bacterium]